MRHEERDACLGFSYFPQIGPAGIRRLRSYFPDLTTAFGAGILELERSGLPPTVVGEFTAWRHGFSAERAWEEMERNKIRFVTLEDAEYPLLLREISAAPPFLYYRGRINSGLPARLAVVGSRQHSPYAKDVVKTLMPDLVRHSIEIVSGLAKGIDTIAHQDALARKGITLAVLGSGLQNIYPRDNLRLAEEIVGRGGALISEFPPDMPPLKTNFPRRNRIISGLARATLVVEAGIKSGALITASYALEQNREVLAVPGSVLSESSAGPNKLIKEGAATVTTSEDILRIFNIEA